MNSIIVKNAAGDDVTIAAHPAPSLLSLSAENPNPEGCDVEFLESGDLGLSWRPAVEADFVLPQLGSENPVFRFPMHGAGFERFAVALRGAIVASGKIYGVDASVGVGAEDLTFYDEDNEIVQVTGSPGASRFTYVCTVFAAYVLVRIEYNGTASEGTFGFDVYRR